MTRGTPKSKSQILEALRLACSDESRAVAFIEAQRWPTGAACPRCGSTAVYMMKDAKTGARNKDFRWRCKDCERMFSVRTSTVLEETRLPLRIWCHAFWRAASSKKGVSAMQVGRECEISYKSALYLMHRVRYALAYIGPEPKLQGTIEADETYVGGKPRIKGKGIREKWTDKQPVVGMLERGGRARLRVVEKVTASTLDAALHEHVAPTARLMTDESSVYTLTGRKFAGGHHTVNHGAKEYARDNGDITTNGIEGVFSLLKRGVYGTFHSVSKKHLHRYLAEFEFRHNTRDLDDGQRAVAALRSAEHKRLTYAALVRAAG